MQENIELQKYLQTLTCSFANPIGYFCINPQCKQPSIICKQFDCKCKSFHKACQTNLFTFFLQLIQKQRRKPTELQHNAFRAVIFEYDNILQRVSSLKNTFIELSENYGVGPITLKFIDSVIYGKKQQITGSLLNSMKKQANTDDQDLLWVFPNQKDIKKHCKQLQEKLQQLMKQLNDYNSVTKFRVQFKSKLLTEKQKIQSINIFNTRHLARLELIEEGNQQSFKQEEKNFFQCTLIVSKSQVNGSVFGICGKKKDQTLTQQKWKQLLSEQIELKRRFMFSFTAQGQLRIMYEQLLDDFDSKKMSEILKINEQDFEGCNMQFFKVHWKD